MKKNITTLKFSFNALTKGIMLLAGYILLSFGSYAQYPVATHSNQFGYVSCAESAIALVQVEDEKGNIVFTKTDDCNGPTTVFGTTANPVFTLSAGSSYTIRINTVGRTPVSSRFDLGSTGAIYLDYNNDFDFTDVGEWISTGQTLQNIPGAVGTNTYPTAPTASRAKTFTVPCTAVGGITRLRVRTSDFSGVSAATSSSRLTDGETEDFVINIAKPATVTSAFFMPDTAFTGTLVNIANSNQNGYLSHEWTIDGTKSSTVNTEYTFSPAGTYNVKLKSTNCLGTDSTTKSIVIVDPTAPAVSDFVSDKNVVELYEPVNLIDLSANGPTYWNWVISNGVDTIDGDDDPSLRGGNPRINQNPTIFTSNGNGAVGLGVWTVTLTASNAIIGSAPETKVGYITVQRSSYNMGAATALPAGIITTASGELFDKGGPTGNYSAGETNEALIAPCGAQSVTLEFTQFKVNANATLKIYDGLNALATPIHTGNGYTLGNEPTGPITASSGAMYLLWTTTAGATNDGFAANWSSVAGVGATPVASFTLPNTTLYNAVPVAFVNTSLNAGGNTTLEWTLTGPENLTSNFKDFAYTFLSNGSYTLSLKVTTCDNQVSTSTQTFTVVSPTTPTNLDFVADNQRPNIGDAVTITATSDKANNWEWSIFPLTGWEADARPNTSNVRSFTFNQPGVYTVQCRAYNSTNELASEATVVKTSYILVVEYCTPIIGVTTSTDIGISYFSLTDPLSGESFENSSATGVEYTDYSDLGAIDLNFGGTYTFEVKRPSNVNDMSRKMWIDWNVDGDFDDAGEEVAAEAVGNNMTWTSSFTVPDASTAFEATTRARIGVSYDTDPNEACGASSNPNANRIGEFEDYLIRVVNDGDEPVITLIDADTVFIEQNATPPYVALGATALDPSQGDISGNITITSDLDQSLAGVYYEVYNVMDASGNAAEPVTRVIYVVADQTAPVITINGANDVTIEVGTPYVDLGATALDNTEGDLTAAIVTSGNVDENLLGVYTITYSIQDNQGNASSETRTVRVTDSQVPIIDNASADKSTACWTVEVQLQNIFADITSASDNYNSIGSGLTFTATPASPQGGAAVDTRFQGTTSVTYTATDESGNITIQCVDYVVRDYVAPEINLRTLDVVNHRVNTPYTPISATASDNLYSSTQISLTSTSNVDAYVLGTYQDTYTATDAAGNIATKIRTVNVIDDLSPVISGKSGGVLTVGVGSSVDALDYITFTDNYDAPGDLLTNHTLVYNNINLQEAGLYSAVFRTEDNSGNRSNEFTLYVHVKYNYNVITNSVNDLNLEDLLSVNPNPTSGNVNINVNLPENEVINLAIFNTMGQQVALVKNGKAQNGIFNVSLANQADGIYYVQMNVQNKIITKKIVLNK
jgi:PKD repeat protein